jgi:hypothetical protein
MIALRLVYIANILVAGWVGYNAFFLSETSANTVFSGAYPANPLSKLVGCLWLSIAFLSVLGLFRPIVFSPVLLIQLFYKGLWLIAVALPAIQNNQAYPKPMATFFLIWVIILPFVIPWKQWLN